MTEKTAKQRHADLVEESAATACWCLLVSCRGDVAEAAKSVGVSRRALDKRIARFNLREKLKAARAENKW